MHPSTGPSQLTDSRNPEDICFTQLTSAISRAQGTVSNQSNLPPISQAASLGHAQKPPIRRFGRLDDLQISATKYAEAFRNFEYSNKKTSLLPYSDDCVQTDMLKGHPPRRDFGTLSEKSVEHFPTIKAKPHTTSSKLRHMPASHSNLRKRAQVHKMNQQHLVPARLPRQPLLLPSPVIDNRKMEFSQAGAHPPSSNHREAVKGLQCEPEYQSYDDLKILSCYEEARHSIHRTWTLPRAESPRPAGPIDELSQFSSLGEQYHVSRQSRKLMRQSNESQESDWLANTNSYEQRLRKFKARCYQIVQHPWNTSNAINRERSGEVVSSCKIYDQIALITQSQMLATVLVGPGKPKIIEIKRPASSHHSTTSSQPSHQASSSSTSSYSPMKSPPSTPIYQLKEISAFSPYDTPSITTPFTDALSASQGRRLDMSQDTVCQHENHSLLPQPLSLGRCDTTNTMDEIIDTFGIRPNSEKSSLPSLGEGLLASTSDIIQFRRSIVDDTSYEKSTQNKAHGKRKNFGLIQSNLEAIATAIERFPYDILDLESEVMADVRVYSGHIKNTQHIDNLSKVFINAPKQLLSWLAAWIIVDLYVSKVSDDSMNVDTESMDSQSLACPPITFSPNRSASLSGPKLKSRILRKETLTNVTHPQSPIKLRKHRRHSSKDLLSATHHDGALVMSASDKARSILGINEREAQDSYRQSVTSRAAMLCPSVGVIAQKLMQLVRSDSDWDPYLWKALSVVISTTEDVYVR